MVGWTDVVIVSLLAVGSVVLVGVLGYLIDKSSAASAEPVDHKPQEDRQ
jgi:hypothetical protein